MLTQTAIRSDSFKHPAMQTTPPAGTHGLSGAIELMGGAIGFNSQPGKGTTFWFTVLLSRQPAEANEGDDPLPVTRQSCSLLPVPPASPSAETTHPVPELSLVFTGTGVNAWLPESFVRGVATLDGNAEVVSEGQLVIAPPPGFGAE